MGGQPATTGVQIEGVETAPQRRGAVLRHVVAAHVLDPSAIATATALGYITSFFYFCGGVACLAATAVPGWSPGADLVAIRAIGVGAVVLSLAKIPVEHRLPRWSSHVLVLLGTVLVSWVIALSGSATMAVAASTFYSYVVIDAVVFFAGPAMVVHLVAAGAAASFSLHRMEAPAAAILVVHVVGFSLALIVAWLTRMSSLAQQDQLTKLVSRRGFEGKIQQALHDVERNGGQLAFVFLDIDGFKAINDTHGHHGGDQVLRRSAETWRAYVGERGTLGRFGGDEFTLLLPGASLGQAADLADELRALLPAGVTASAGVTSWQARDTPSTLAGRADIALYEAKAAGRDRTVVYGDPRRTASELEAAIANGEMVLEFQPVVDLADGRTTSYEALVRWDHPTKGRIPPGDFIPQAERTGAIHALGAWALDQACRAAARSGTDDGWVRVSVNASIPELRRSGYAGVVAHALRTHGLDPDQLTIEVTEALFDDDDPQVGASLGALRALGVKLAIDDFGAGYSSLRWLERLPVDVIKVDGTFVQAITGPHQRTPVLSGIVDIGRTLGLAVVIEGVETEVQAAVLRGIGADLAQGFLFARPAPLVDGRLPRPSPAAPDDGAHPAPVVPTRGPNGDGHVAAPVPGPRRRSTVTDGARRVASHR